MPSRQSLTSVSVVVSILCSVAVVACSPAASKDSVVSGKALGVISLGGGVLNSSSVKYFPISVRIVVMKENEIVNMTTSAKDGFFKVGLPAGDYSFRIITHPKSYGRCEVKPATVIVRSSSVTNLKAYCGTSVDFPG